MADESTRYHGGPAEELLARIEPIRDGSMLSVDDACGLERHGIDSNLSDLPVAVDPDRLMRSRCGAPEPRVEARWGDMKGEADRAT